MVIDTLENLEKYVSLNPLFNDVVDFLKSNDLNKLSEGKHLIKGTDLFVNIQVAKVNHVKVLCWKLIRK